MRVYRKTVAITVAAIVGCGALAAIAAAVSDTSSGTNQLQMDNRSDTAASTSNAVAWTTLPGSQVPAGIFALSTRLFNARFTAESACTATGSGYCRVRIVAVRDSGLITELSPIVGDEFAFDSVDTSAVGKIVEREGHAMQRSRRLPQGNYQLQVQYSVSNPGVTFELDDWHFAVESSA